MICKLSWTTNCSSTYQRTVTKGERDISNELLKIRSMRYLEQLSDTNINLSSLIWSSWDFFFRIFLLYWEISTGSFCCNNWYLLLQGCDTNQQIRDDCFQDTEGKMRHFIYVRNNNRKLFNSKGIQPIYFVQII